MNASEDLGDGAGSGEVASGLAAAPAIAKELTPMWVVGFVALLAIFPMVSWLRRRCAVSLLIALSAFASVGALISYGEPFLDMDRFFWSWADLSIGLVLDLIAVFYIFSAHHPCTYLLAVLTVGFVLADLLTEDKYAFNLSWHVTAYILLGLIPGQLNMSVDSVDYYYQRRRERVRERERPRHVLVPRDDAEDWDPDYPGLYIPRGTNYFQ